MFNPIASINKMFDRIGKSTGLRDREQFIISDICKSPKGYNEEERPRPLKDGIPITPEQLLNLTDKQEEWLFDTLCECMGDVQRRWVPRSDYVVHGKKDYWRKYSEIDLEAKTLFGDCDCWCAEVAYRMLLVGLPFRLMVCQKDHLIVECVGYILDMNQGAPRGNLSLINMDYASISGYARGDDWREIKKEK